MWGAWGIKPRTTRGPKKPSTGCMDKVHGGDQIGLGCGRGWGITGGDTIIILEVGIICEVGEIGVHNGHGHEDELCKFGRGWGRGKWDGGTFVIIWSIAEEWLEVICCPIDGEAEIDGVPSEESESGR